ncbi:MAG: arylamine N-acetyltransferase [Burkholderiales bacterium]|nr:arylamine N-acetyltransferase [Burkholderiales bacterium]
MTDMVDLDAYFERIRWGGGTRPDYDTLAGILLAHMARIPFENLDVLLGRGIRLDPEGVQRKLVGARRGGYCFEHATLLAAVLEQLGFAPVRHTARVVNVLPRTESPRTHMFLTVPLAAGTFVLDPGFGALAPRVPVPLQDGVAARIGAETNWMARDGNHWIMRARVADQDVDCWVSTLEREHAVDFELGNHYTATHPASPFLHRIMLRALTDDGRVAVMNRDVTIRRAGVAQALRLADRAALQALLLEHFGIDLPEVARLRVPAIPEWD